MAPTSTEAFGRTLASVALALGLGLGGAAQAHVTLAEPSAVQGSHHRAAFKVAHGCAGSPTVALVVDLPEGLEGAKPMPKPGWQLRTERRPLALPVQADGRRATERVARVVWEGGELADGHYDEFVVQFQVRAAPGPVWIPVEQICAQGRHRWTEVPVPGQDPHALAYPAAALEVLAPTAGHHHH